MPVSNDYHADDDPPVIILGCERSEYHPPTLTPYVLVLFIAAVVFMVASALIGVATPPEVPQEPESIDRDMPTETIAGDVPR